MVNGGNVLSLQNTSTTTAITSISKSIVTKEIDLEESAAVFTTSSSTSLLNIKSLTSEIKEKCSDKNSHRTTDDKDDDDDEDEIVTYHDTNFNESNKNSSSECSISSPFANESLYNGSEEFEIRQNKVNISEEFFKRTARRNARRKSKNNNKVTTATAQSTKNVTSRVQNRGKVSLLGLFELTSRAGLSRAEGKSELAAAELAVKHINERRLLKGYTLELITNDTQVMAEN